MTVVYPEGDASVPETPAEIVGIHADLPSAFVVGDAIVVSIELDRPLSPIELRMLADRGPAGWTGIASISELRVEVTKLTDGTLLHVKQFLQRVNKWAHQEAAKAAEVRSTLDRLIAEWES